MRVICRARPSQVFGAPNLKIESIKQAQRRESLFGTSNKSAFVCLLVGRKEAQSTKRKLPFVSVSPISAVGRIQHFSIEHFSIEHPASNTRRGFQTRAPTNKRNPGHRVCSPSRTNSTIRPHFWPQFITTQVTKWDAIDFLRVSSSCCCDKLQLQLRMRMQLQHPRAFTIVASFSLGAPIGKRPAVRRATQEFNVGNAQCS